MVFSKCQFQRLLSQNRYHLYNDGFILILLFVNTTVYDFTIGSTGCDQGWDLFDGHCYRYVQTAANWNEAKVVN